MHSWQAQAGEHGAARRLIIALPSYDKLLPACCPPTYRDRSRDRTAGYDGYPCRIELDRSHPHRSAGC